LSIWCLFLLWSVVYSEGDLPAVLPCILTFL